MTKPWLLFFSLTLILISTFSAKAIAYPREQLQECITAAKSNSAIVDIPEMDISDFCDCALKAIVDEGKDESSSANDCARRNLNK